MRLRVRPGFEAAKALTEIKLTVAHFPGPEPVVILVGTREFTLGEPWNCDGSCDCAAALSEFGEVIA